MVPEPSNLRAAVKREKCDRHTLRNPREKHQEAHAQPLVPAPQGPAAGSVRTQKGPRWPGSTMRLTMTPSFLVLNKGGLALSFARVTRVTQARGAPGGGTWAAQCPVHSRSGPSCAGAWKSRELSSSVREIFLSPHHAQGGRRLGVIHFPRSTQHGELDTRPDTEPYSEQAPPRGVRWDCR